MSLKRIVSLVLVVAVAILTLPSVTSLIDDLTSPREGVVLVRHDFEIVTFQITTSPAFEFTYIMDGNPELDFYTVAEGYNIITDAIPKFYFYKNGSDVPSNLINQQLKIPSDYPEGTDKYYFSGQLASQGNNISFNIGGTNSGSRLLTSSDTSFALEFYIIDEIPPLVTGVNATLLNIVPLLLVVGLVFGAFIVIKYDF